MKCVVINLKRAVERKHYMSKQLNKLSQKFEFFEGIDWKNIDPFDLSNTVKNKKIKNSYRKLSLGYMACNLSHRKVLKKFVNSSEKIIAVLEDDVKLNTDLPEVLSALEDSSHHFDIVFLHRRNKQNNLLVNLKSISTNYALSLSKKEEAGALGYAITRSAAKQFLQVTPQVCGPIDDALHAYYFHGLKTYTLNPQIVFCGEVGINHSYNLEQMIRGKNLKEEISRLFPKYYGHILHEIHFRRRIRTEKLIA